MPNHCSNILYVTAKDDNEDAVEELKKFEAENFVEDDDGEPRFSFRKVLPPPDDRILDTTDGFNGKIPGLPDGYHWSCETWGTKWDAYDFGGVTRERLPSDEGSMVSFPFFTAWSPPIPVIRALGEKYPNLVFSLHFEERGMGFIGDFEMADGNETMHETREVVSVHDALMCGGG